MSAPPIPLEDVKEDIRKLGLSDSLTPLDYWIQTDDEADVTMCCAGCQHVRLAPIIIQLLHPKPFLSVNQTNKDGTRSRYDNSQRTTGRPTCLPNAPPDSLLCLLSETADAGVCDLCVSVLAATLV